MLEVKATDGKAVTITLNEKTKILRGKTKATADDLKPGERVVVTATETKGKDGQTTDDRIGDSAARSSRCEIATVIRVDSGPLKHRALISPRRAGI